MTTRSTLDATTDEYTRHESRLLTFRGNWGSGFIFFHFSDTNLVNFAETFFSSRDKTILRMTLHTLAAFFMPRFSAITA